MVVATKENKQQEAFTSHSDWFAAFLRHTDQKAITKNAVLDGIKKNYPKVWTKITEPESPLNLLYVGVGTGGWKFHSH